MNISEEIQREIEEGTPGIIAAIEAGTVTPEQAKEAQEQYEYWQEVHNITTGWSETPEWHPSQYETEIAWECCAAYEEIIEAIG